MKRCSLCLEEVSAWNLHCMTGVVNNLHTHGHLLAMPHELTLDNLANYYRCGSRIEYAKRFFYEAGD